MCDSWNFVQQGKTSNFTFLWKDWMRTLSGLQVHSGNCWWPLQWRHNGHDGVSNHQPHHCWLQFLFRLRSTITSKLRVTGLCVGNSPVTGEFLTQRASNLENVSIWWCHHDQLLSKTCNWISVDHQHWCIMVLPGLSIAFFIYILEIYLYEALIHSYIFN